MRSVLPALSGLLLISASGFAASDLAIPDAAGLQRMSARFVPVEVKSDATKLPANEYTAYASPRSSRTLWNKREDDSPPKIASSTRTA